MNVQSTLALGEARGVAMFVAAEQGLAVTGYPPATVKKAVVGHGRATKEQIGYLVRALLALRRTPAAGRRRRAGDRHLPRAAASRRRGAREPRVIALPARAAAGQRDGDVTVIDVAGVGYQVLVSAATAGVAAAGGEVAAVYAHATSSRTSRCACTASPTRPSGGCSRR